MSAPHILNGIFSLKNDNSLLLKKYLGTLSPNLKNGQLRTSQIKKWTAPHPSS